jgi:hypothetical protein
MLKESNKFRTKTKDPKLLLTPIVLSKVVPLWVLDLVRKMVVKVRDSVFF